MQKHLPTLKLLKKQEDLALNEPNSSKLILEKTVDGEKVRWEYNGNGQGVYMYAKCLLKSEKVDAFKAFLRKQGYELKQVRL